MAPPEGRLTNRSFDLAEHVVGLIGPGVASDLGGLIQGKSPAFVTDTNLAASGVLAPIDVSGSEWLTIDPGEPSEASILSLARRLIGFDSIVAVGGGSVIDTAKLAGALGASGPYPPDSVRRPLRSHLPVVAVPTTAGSGAEVTRTVVFSSGGAKDWAWDERLRPDRVVVDARLTTSLPLPTTVATGLDAFVHAVEAATSQTSAGVVPHAALASLSAARQALPAVIAEPRDVEARHAMLTASVAAGLAIDACGTGIAHGLGHSMGSLIPLPHGLAVAFSLWLAADLNEASRDPRCAVVADALGGASYSNAVSRLIEATPIFDLLGRFAREFPLAEADLTERLLAPENRPMLANNVHPVASEQVRDLVRAAVSEWERLGGRR